jgi:esterase/lipase
LPEAPATDRLQPRSRSTPATGIGSLTLEREYDTQLSHTIWELERALKRGSTSEALRHSLIEAHGQHLRHMEEIAQVPRHQRSQLLLQPRPTDAVLILPGEGSGCDELQTIGEAFYRRGFTVLATNLAFRSLERPAYTPAYWQTCLDEAENRYDILQHWSTRIAIIGAGLAGLIALHLAVTRRPSEIVALFPAFASEANWLARLRATLRRLVLRDDRPPQDWGHQRTLVTRSAREALGKISVPLFVVAEDRKDRSEMGRSSQVAQRLVHRAATQVRVLRPGEAASLRDLSPGVIDEMLAFLRRK